MKGDNVVFRTHCRNREIKRGCCSFATVPLCFSKQVKITVYRRKFLYYDFEDEEPDDQVFK